MPLLPRVFSFWRNLVHRDRVERDLDEELRAAFELLVHEKIRAGMRPADARRAATLELGRIEALKEQVRTVRSGAVLDTCLQDVRHAARQLARRPAFAAVAIVTLAFGIGMNTAVFTIVDAVILRPLPYPDANRLVAVHEIGAKAGRIPVSDVHFDEWNRSARSFERLALLWGYTVNLTGATEPERVAAARVSPSLFAMLGVQTQLGRTLLDQEDQAGRDRVVLISDSLWRRRFAADPIIIGRTIGVDGQAHEIVGVLPPGFFFPRISDLYGITIDADRPELWKPLALTTAERRAALGGFNFASLGQLTEGVSIQDAAVELNRLQADIARRLPGPPGLRAELVPLRDQIGGRSRSGLQLILAAVGMVLLIACVNITNLLLAYGTARRREMAVRGALGASRGRLIRQLVTESLVLAAAGGACGAALAVAALHVIVTSAPVTIPRLDAVQIDARVLIFTISITVLTGLVVSVFPAWRSATVSLQEAMKSGAGSTVSGGTRRARWIQSALVSQEVALTAICLVAGGVLLRSFVTLLNVDKGFDATRIATIDVNLPDLRYPTLESRVGFQRALLDRVRAVPGVTSASVADKQLLSGHGINTRLSLAGTNEPIAEHPLANLRAVSPTYFQTLGIGLRNGRIFEEVDGARPVAVLSAALAERLWPGQNAVGKRFRRGGGDSPLIEVVGVASDVRGVRLDREPMFTVYVPYWQVGRTQISLALKTEDDARALANPVRELIRRMDPELPVPALRTMEDVVSDSVADRRFQVDLVLAFGVAALILAAIGIYGLVSYTVAQRIPEIGVRLALGAGRARVMWMVLADVWRLVAIALIAGVAGGVAAASWFRSLLFGIAPGDPLAIATASIAVAMTATLAASVPALRASSVDAIQALRTE